VARWPSVTILHHPCCNGYAPARQVDFAGKKGVAYDEIDSSEVTRRARRDDPPRRRPAHGCADLHRRADIGRKPTNWTHASTATGKLDPMLCVTA